MTGKRPLDYHRSGVLDNTQLGLSAPPDVQGAAALERLIEARDALAAALGT